ncbi:FAD-linked oxidase C-terminal domain-containing protein [Aureibaculum sp. 2210JD6-5]|uniref:FAD-binding and (Fe-S)-binding domain-containing protein n=1 Tax=Aureibaculum sp. 2210JD6-5 TaxID=3103957 RepID=UPI002AAEE8E6|nr:FAD-linked oxidase C-terminal domain-containing protein [Aureibaculum sp. 2210JD6-5]MDY7395544.1 FAD-linked oxidase C-terminal domain-containing protein [Aureibaculum sp. 2210JD6-5]
MPSTTKINLPRLEEKLSGELFFDDLHKSIYATDASVYRKIPLAVALPKNSNDLKLLIDFAQTHQITLIPRAAGTSLAGQCVGDGIVVDISKYFTEILEFDENAKTITVQPGIVRDELNLYLKPFGLFFGPNTSTSNRCMIGGMVGNNSSGTTSIQYGVTRDKIISLNVSLSDGSETVFESLDKDTFNQKLKGKNLESGIYNTLFHELSDKENQREIIKEFPKPSIHRRNTGYAVDELLKTSIFTDSNEHINIAKLLCGSEGTLAFTTAIKLQLDDLPPPKSVVVAAHFNSIQESLEATVVAMNHNLYTCELMDKTILDCTKNNREQLKNRYFVEGDPKAILLLEIKADTDEETDKLADILIVDLKKHNFGYAYPKLFNEDSEKAAELRKAGLGLLGNIVGDNKAVACIEDTAVDLKDLPEYIKEFTAMMDNYGQKAVYYAHAGAGELHLRPILNLKKSEDVVLFKTITTETAKLVKKYKGSFSGEHGDGIVRGAFIPMMIGDKNYELLKRIKYAFDPNNIFNKGKIVDAFPMDESLRYEVDRKEPDIKTLMDFSDSEGILKAAEKCNGSGDCRKTTNMGGMMCPSYRATLDEKDTTRARANALREFLTIPIAIGTDNDNKFDHEELKKVFDLCLSCKACASECPSNVDVASFKAEFLYQYQKVNKPSFRTKMFANNVKYNKWGSIFPTLTNTILNTSVSKKVMGIAIERSVPKLAKQTLRKWIKKNKSQLKPTLPLKGKLTLFCDEFTNYYDVQIGIDAIKLLTKLGYKINFIDHVESGRSHISKGFLDEAKALANKNIAVFKDNIHKDNPLVGIEPSAILTFRDEYLRLAEDKEAAKSLAFHAYTIEEFLSNEIVAGNINTSQFTRETKEIKIHGHCHQKSLSTISATFNMLNLPENYEVTIINSGCCGMAGSFGYEKEHYELSMQVGEQSLFSKIRKLNPKTEISAAGTSCRHQIFDGTQKVASHPVQILLQALE